MASTQDKLKVDFSKDLGPQQKHKNGWPDLVHDVLRYEHSTDIPAQDIIRFIEDSAANGQLLDIGSGWEKEGYQLSEKYAVEVGWFALNPALADDFFRHDINGQIDEVKNMSFKRRAYAGLAQQLPFKDRAFNCVLASWSIPTCLEEITQQKMRIGTSDSEEYQDKLTSTIHSSMREMQRVLVDGGKAIIFPVRLKSTLQAIVEEFDDLCEVEILSSPIDYGHVYAEDPDNPQEYMVVATKIAGA